VATLRLVGAIRRRLRRAWRGVAQLVESRWGAPALFALALLVFALGSLAEPVSPGRDAGRYLLVYAQLFDEHVVFPWALASRTPVAPLVIGPLLDAGPVFVELGAAILYASSIVAWVAVARRFGSAAAVATAACLLLYPGYLLLFHRLSSDAVFAAGFACVALLFVRAAERRTPARAAALGLGVAALVLVRPVAQPLLVLLLLALVVPGPWRARVRLTAAFTVVALLPLGAWAVHNAYRADDFTLQRGSGATLPLFRAFVADRIVDPTNGPASRAVARAVAQDLLPNEPYRSRRIQLDEFFSSGSARMHDDLIGLSDRTWGWDDDYRQLSRVGREAVLAHPGAYARGVAGDLRDLLVWPLYAEISEQTPADPQDAPTEPTPGAAAPIPSDDEPIPSGRQASYVSTPDGRIREVWTSPTEHGFVFDEPRDEAGSEALNARLGELTAAFPDRQQRTGLLEWLNSASRWYPRPVMWLLLGALACAIRRPRGIAPTAVLAVGALLTLLGTSLAVYAVAEYSVPVVPAFVLLATAGLFGPRARAG
jgi:hypothetical protein